jgi:hypothetical protein
LEFVVIWKAVARSEILIAGLQPKSARVRK